MNKKRLFKSLVLLFSSSLALGTFLSLRLAHKKDDINVALAYEGTPLPTSGTLSAGTYYLASDQTVSSQLKITSGDVIVNLNGHTLNGGGRDKGIFHVTGGTLTVNGKDDVTGNRGALNDGGGYYPGSGFSYGGALYITAGAATFSDLDITKCQANWGGAISMSNSAVTLNNCNLSKNEDTNGYGFYGVIRVGDSSAAGQGLTVNGGEMFSNDGAISVGNKAKVTINGAYIHDNTKLGVTVDTEGSLKISGNTIIEDNQPSSIRNLSLNNAAKIGIVSELGAEAHIGITMSGDKGVFTNSTDTSLNDASKFVSDDSSYAVAKNADGQLFLGAARTVTFSTLHGTAPDPVKVVSGYTIPEEPTEPTAEHYVFLGWYKESTFENAWDFATDTVTSDITLYAKWVEHTHSFTYSALGNTITATCDNTDGNCPFPECKATLTVSGPSGSSNYDGTAKEAVITDTSKGVAFTNVTITYYKQDDPSFTGLPIDAGTYIALVSFDESTLRASIQYDILKVDSSVDDVPTANSLTYKGYAQELVSAGTASGGTMVYSLDGIAYSESIPTATDVGEYTVYYKVIGDANHNDSEVGTVVVTIAQATASITNGTDVTYYDSFAEAVSNWTDNTTLTMLKDVSISSAITVNDNSTKTFDLNGYGLLMTGSDRVFNLGGSSNVTITDSNPNSSHKIQLNNYRGVAVDEGCTTTDPVNNGTGIVNITGGYITGGDARSQGGGEAGGILVQGTGSDRDIISFTMEGGTVIGNLGTYAGGISIYSHTTTVSNSSVLYNKATQLYGSGGIHSNGGYITLCDSDVEYNVGYGVFDGFNGNKLSVSGKVIVRNNIDNSNATANVMVYSAEDSSHKSYVTVIGELSDDSYIGVRDSGNRVFTNTNSEEIAYNKIGVFHSDNSNFIVGKNASGQLLTGTPRTVTYTTEHGTAPDSDTVANGSIIYNEPTSPSQEGYEFKGWYKDSGFENAWDFETDTVTSNTTLYAKWGYDEATGNVIKLINDIGDLTYAGGADDSLDDIIAAKAAYDALTPGQKAVVNGVNKDVLDHDIVTYNHVDKVGDLIKAIPEASDSQEYYDAVETALAAYKALTDEEKAILNADLDFQYKKTLDDNKAAKEVIELIQDIGEVTYKGGQDDSKDDINNALDAYNNLNDDQKAIVDNANKDELDDAKETYDNVDEAVNLINSIGDINHGGENDSKEAINAAREAYDNLSDEEKALVKAFNNSTQTLEDAEEVYDVLVKIDDIGEGDDEEKIKAAREAYDALTSEQKDQVGDKYVQKLITAENHSKDANILFIVFLILFILLIVSGLIVMYILLKRRKNENNDNNKQVKLASVSGLLPLVVLASYFTSSKFILVYVLGAVAILIWLTNLILFVSKKKQKEVKLEVKPETVALTTPQTIQNELVTEGEVVAPEIIPEDAKEEVISKVQDKEAIKHHESISVSKADEEMSDEKAESSIEEVEVIKPRKGKKEIINIDTLSENYNNGDEVTLESLKKKGLVPATTGRIKVLARGVLDKKLNVIADDFSIPAIKMIVLVGGHVKKIK